MWVGGWVSVFWCGWVWYKSPSLFLLRVVRWWDSSHSLAWPPQRSTSPLYYGEVGQYDLYYHPYGPLTSHPPHTCIHIQGIFSLLLLFEGRALNMSPIVEKLTPQLTILMKLLSSGTCDRRLLWGTVCVVLDGVQELLESLGGVVLGAAGVIGATLTGTSLLDSEQQHVPHNVPFLNTHTTGGYLGELLTSLQGSELARLLQLVEGVASSLSSHHHTLTARTTSQDIQSKLDTLKGPTVNTNTLYVLLWSLANLPYHLHVHIHTNTSCLPYVLATLWPCPFVQVPRPPPLHPPPLLLRCTHHIHM